MRFYIKLIACAVMVLATTACGLRQGNRSAYGELPDRYLFLLFPKAVCGESVCPDRVLLVTKQELDTGEVKFTDAAGTLRSIEAKYLTFLPEPGVEQLLKQPQKTLAISGYAALEWDSHPGANGETDVQLKLDDSKHARIEIYSYHISQNRVAGAEVVATRSWVDLLAGMVFLAILIIVALIWRVRKKSRSVQKS